MAALNRKLMKGRDRHKTLQSKKKPRFLPTTSTENKDTKVDLLTHSNIVDESVIQVKTFGMHNRQPVDMRKSVSTTVTKTVPDAMPDEDEVILDITERRMVNGMFQGACTDSMLVALLEFGSPCNAGVRKEGFMRVVEWDPKFLREYGLKPRPGLPLTRALHKDRIKQGSKREATQQAIKAGYGTFRKKLSIGEYTPFSWNYSKMYKSRADGQSYIIWGLMLGVDNKHWKDSMETYRSEYRDIYFEKYGDKNMSEHYVPFNLEWDLKTEQMYFPVGNVYNPRKIVYGDPSFDEELFQDNEAVNSDVYSASEETIPYNRVSSSGENCGIMESRPSDHYCGNEGAVSVTDRNNVGRTAHNPSPKSDFEATEVFLAWDQKCEDNEVSLSLDHGDVYRRVKNKPDQVRSTTPAKRRSSYEELEIYEEQKVIQTRWDENMRKHEDDRLLEGFRIGRIRCRLYRVKQSISDAKSDTRPIANLYGFRLISGLIGTKEPYYTAHYPRFQRDGLDSAIETCLGVSAWQEDKIRRHLKNGRLKLADFYMRRKLRQTNPHPFVPDTDIKKRVSALLAGRDVPRIDVVSRFASITADRIIRASAVLSDSSPLFIGPPKPLEIRMGLHQPVVCGDQILMPEDIDFATLQGKPDGNPYKGKFYPYPLYKIKGSNQKVALFAKASQLARRLFRIEERPKPLRYNVTVDSKGKIHAIPRLMI